VRRVVVTLVILGLVGATARAGELEDLRAENARLQAQVDRLERENARLRRIGPDPARMDDAAVAERVTVTTQADGSTLTTATVPLTVTSSSSAAHDLELTSTGGTARATFQSWFSGGIHASDTEVVLEADGAVFHLPVVDHDTTRITTGPPQRRRRRDHERLTVNLPADVLEAAATAHSVGGRLGRVEFLIEPRDQATLRAFARRTSGTGR
jgi:hypothetical protein